IYVAGLQSIPAELYEAADMDGAGRWQRFRYVTWPQLAAPTGIVMAYTTVQSFKAFDLILGLSGLPPKASMDILSTRIYPSFANSQYGYAAAESVLFMLLIAVVTWLQRRAIRAVHPSEDCSHDFHSRQACPAARLLAAGHRAAAGRGLRQSEDSA